MRSGLGRVETEVVGGNAGVFARGEGGEVRIGSAIVFAGFGFLPFEAGLDSLFCEEGDGACCRDFGGGLEETMAC